MSTKRKTGSKGNTVYHKCIYCQQELTKGKRSTEHVVNRSILPKHNHKLTLTKKVCAHCNSSFGEIDQAFVKNTIIGFNRFVMDVINDENRWDNAQEPFTIKDLSRTIKGDQQRFSLITNPEHDQLILRGIAKIALNALIYDKVENDNDYYLYVRNDEVFDGHEEELSGIKTFIKKGGEYHIQVVRTNRPLLVYNPDYRYEGQISLNNITDPRHVIAIHKCQSHYYGIIGLFIGIMKPMLIYFVPIIGDKHDINADNLDPQVVRNYNIGCLFKTHPHQEVIRSDVLYIPEGNTSHIITLVKDIDIIHYINATKNIQELS